MHFRTILVNFKRIFMIIIGILGNHDLNYILYISRKSLFRHMKQNCDCVCKFKGKKSEHWLFCVEPYTWSSFFVFEYFKETL
jgi:hypothetical protein